MKYIIFPRLEKYWYRLRFFDEFFFLAQIDFFEHFSSPFLWVPFVFLKNFLHPYTLILILGNPIPHFNKVRGGRNYVRQGCQWSWSIKFQVISRHFNNFKAIFEVLFCFQGSFSR